jgi:ABC-type dipeptide/oligopeptide/nickel transport system permease subunit
VAGYDRGPLDQALMRLTGAWPARATRGSWAGTSSRTSSARCSRRRPFWPGVAIFVLALSFNLAGDGLRDLLDPRNH